MTFLFLFFCICFMVAYLFKDQLVFQYWYVRFQLEIQINVLRMLFNSGQYLSGNKGAP